MRKNAMVCREITTLILVGQQNTQVILPFADLFATTTEAMVGRRSSQENLGDNNIEERSWKEELRRALWSNLEARLL
jgi:hypothetical protein